MTLEKFTKGFIKLFLVYVISALMFNCRTVKKEWVNENFAEKSEVLSIKETTENYIKTEASALNKSLNEKYNEFSKKLSENTSEKQNESTKISGTITAEDGKKKSVTFGGTTINSDGANISFESSSTKEFNKEIQSEIQELKQERIEMLAIIENHNKTIDSNTKSIEQLKSLIETEKAVKTKEVKKSGLTFTTLLIIGLIILFLILLFYFRHKIYDRLKKISSFFA